MKEKVREKVSKRERESRLVKEQERDSGGVTERP